MITIGMFENQIFVFNCVEKKQWNQQEREVNEGSQLLVSYSFLVSTSLIRDFS